MKRIKRLLLLSSLMLITGCTAKYNLIINDDLSVSDEITASETIKYYDENYSLYDRNTAITNLWDNMSSIFDYSRHYTYKINDNNTGIVAVSEYSSLQDYINRNSIYKQYFEKIDFSLNDDIITIKTSGDFYPYVEQDPERFPIDSFSLNIKLPFKVLNSNADLIDGNTYTWHINKDTKEKSIYLEFDSSKKVASVDYKMLITITVIILLIIGIYIYYNKLINKGDINEKR